MVGALALGAAFLLLACEYKSDYRQNLYAGDPPCAAGKKRHCGTNLGACETGEQLCADGEWGLCTGQGPEAETCDGQDNDCDGQIDEGCKCVEGSLRPCGTDLGECEVGHQACQGGFWAACSGVGPALETCDGADNDCDGETDEGFDVGEPCELSAGCPGIRACQENLDGVECVPHPTPEVCDGVDNDCDGYTDYWSRGSRLFSACECVEQPLAFGPTSIDASIEGAGLLCAPTACDGSGGEFGMSFCLVCAKDPYAMCISEGTSDMSAFVAGEPERVLRAHYSFESPAVAKTPVHLYYQVQAVVGKESYAFRRYYRLLDAGDAPGSHTRVFSAEHGCFARNELSPIDCAGSSDVCPMCRLGDTCGSPVGADCAGLNFAAAQLQVAVDAAPCAGNFQGTVQIHDLSYGPLACESP